MTLVTFTALGIPIPKGSTRAFMPKGWKRPVITSDNPLTRPWEDIVAYSAIEALGNTPPMECPVSLRLSFYLPRPKSAPKRVTRPAKKPDLDKLVRAAKDALKRAGLYADDAQVVHVEARKEFAGGAHDVAGPSGLPRLYVQAYPAADAAMAATPPNLDVVTKTDMASTTATPKRSQANLVRQAGK